MFRIMESERKCTYCLKEFSTVSSKNRHERNFHGAMLTTKTKRFVCPLCDHEPFPARSKLIEHFQSFHDIDIEENTYHFRNITEYESWKALENREVDFRLSERRKSSNKTDERLYYNCNRSDYKGFVSTCQKRSPKCGGSIKIKGICPARFVATIYHEGPVVVSFTKTHVGHTVELRSKRLSKSEEKGIANQLIAGVSTERIIQDARIVEEGEIKRINVITRVDLAYLMRKYNIDKRRHTDDMIATTLKIQEWNRQGNEHAFLFKKIGTCTQDILTK